MKSKSFMLMILSMGFGLIAAIGISQVMGRPSAPVNNAPKMAPVLVAADHLDHNALLTEENVRIENWPVEIIPEEAANDIEQIKNKAITHRLSKGLPIMKTDMVHKKDISTLAIPEGFKVVAIKVAEDDTIAGLLNPGDKVDVIGLFKTVSRSGQKKTFSKTFLKALRVFSVNAKMSATGSRAENTERGSAIVGVLVNERQAEAIVYVQKTGQLKLVLRGDYVAGDDENTDDMIDFGQDFEEEEFVEDEGPDEEPQQQVYRPFGASQNANDAPSMIVWQGGQAEKVTFQEGELPSSTRNRDREREEAEEEYKGDEDPDSFEDSDRGLEEDQYPGE